MPLDSRIILSGVVPQIRSASEARFEQLKNRQAEQTIQLNDAKLREMGATEDDLAMWQEAGGDIEKMPDVLAKHNRIQESVQLRKSIDEHKAAMNPEAATANDFTLGPGQIRYGAGGKVIAQVPKEVAEQAASGFTLGPNQVRYGADGKLVASGPLTPSGAGANAGSFEDYVIRVAKDKGVAVEALTSRDIEAARRKYMQADDRPQQSITVPVVIQTSEGPQLLNKTTGTTTPIKTAGGETVKPAPTADMRNKVAARELVGKSIGAIEALSKKIITRVGPAQRAAAITRGAEAVFGSDPEFRVYQDARMSLAGNLAVGQQGSRPSDADIKAIWLPMVPDAYRDTSESAAMKWSLIKTMSNTDTGGGGISVKAPNGKTYTFQSQAQADEFKKKAGIP